MKKIHIYIIAAITMIVMASCTSSHDISIYGKPGTEVFDSNMKKMTVIPDSGKSTINVSDDDYHAFLLAREKDSKDIVPFAINYKRDYHVGAAFLENTGLVIGCVGLGVTLISEMVMLLSINDEKVSSGAAMVCLAGLGVTGAGIAMSVPAAQRRNQDQYEYNYKYISNQFTNDKVKFSPLVQNSEYKTISNTGKPTVINQKNTGLQSIDNHNTKNNPQNNSTSKGDYASTVEGSYVGKGKLINSGNIIDKYNNIKVVISKTSENLVSVAVVMDDGMPYFSNATYYKVSKNDDNIILKASNINSTITINEYSELVYINHNVENNGEMCTLKINADLE